MDDLNILRTLITIGGVLVTVAGAWFTVKYGLKANTEKIEKLAKQVAVQWKRLDEISVEAQQFETTIDWIRSDIAELKDEEKWRRRNLAKDNKSS
tara:strand:+ start:2676 stop:2960 length:285 start_codon:yes stop_codon:yes gene_type:complete